MIFSYVTYTTDCPLGGRDSRVIRNSNPDHRFPHTVRFAEKTTVPPTAAADTSHGRRFSLVHWVLQINNAVLSIRREASISSTS